MLQQNEEKLRVTKEITSASTEPAPLAAWCMWILTPSAQKNRTGKRMNVCVCVGGSSANRCCNATYRCFGGSDDWGLNARQFERGRGGGGGEEGEEEGAVTLQTQMDPVSMLAQRLKISCIIYDIFLQNQFSHEQKIPKSCLTFAP